MPGVVHGSGVGRGPLPTCRNDAIFFNQMSRVMRKPTFCICENKDADQLRGNREAVTAKLISAFVFATQIVQSLYFLNPKFQASSHLL